MKTYLMSSGELRIIAAASGMESFLMFEPKPQDSRGVEMQSILRLVNDGFLISEDTSIKPEPSLVPLLYAFQHSSHAIVARLVSGEAAPICIYTNHLANSFLRITPHSLKEDFYKISIVDGALLLDDAESSHFLPMLHDVSFHSTPEADNSVGAIDDTPEQQMDDETLSHLITTGLLSTFERYDLSTHVLLQKLSIFQTPFAWYMATHSEAGKRLKYYSRDEFAAWLKGEF